jgi:prepilin-type N-terminal cleavage/methylation domain-containing protein
LIQRRTGAAPEASTPDDFNPPGPFPTGSRRAFTLIELMLVVLIIGLVYGLAINRIERSNDDAQKLTLENLVDFMQRQHHHNRLSLICTERCGRCMLFADGKLAVESLPPFLDDAAESYRFDTYLGYERIEFAPIFDPDGREEEVCFRYDLLPGGGRSEMMVASRGRVVALPGPFGKTAVYDSLDSAVEAKRALHEELR